MSTDFALSDRSTWITILSVVAAALTSVFHQSLAAYVPAAATIAAGLVVAGVALAKHHYAAALEAVDAAAAGTAAQVPPGGELHLIAQRIGSVLADAGAALGATSPPAAVSAPQAAPVAQPVPPAVPAAPAAV
jgi:hypothetical protein